MRCPSQGLSRLRWAVPPGVRCARRDLSPHPDFTRRVPVSTVPSADDAADRERQRGYERKYAETHREKRRESQRAYRQANRDRLAAEKREQRTANLERALQAEREAGRRYRETHREELRQRNRERYRADPNRGNRPVAARARPGEGADRRQQRLLARHGLSPGAWQALWDAQGGRCYLCTQRLNADEAVIEHDHRCCPQGYSCTACRRGLSCPHCNLIIGLADDDPDRLIAIAANLRVALEIVGARIAARPAVQGDLLAGWGEEL